ncbi:MAG: hypothetical protein COA63_014255 [Methylophaga sp.]|nr:hypothetical protein [Methylophaga sp.]
MAKFEYYKRGAGELNTSNFPTILREKTIYIKTLDEKTFMSLLALQTWVGNKTNLITVRIAGYVAHLRGDKDLFPMSRMYDLLTLFKFECRSIQHESTDKIKSIQITQDNIEAGFDKPFYQEPIFIGADGSVIKFFPHANHSAEKVRRSGKVTGMKFDTNNLDSTNPIIIVDDILGGGATIQMLINILRKAKFTNDLFLWVEYNEGIHTKEFLKQFADYHIGEII